MTTIRIKHARRDFRAHRDDAGVPHISGETWHDVLYGLGYLHALDRGTQLLFARTIAAGEAAGRIADNAELLETDRFFRRLGLHLNLDYEVSSLEDGVFDQITTYCQGVNDGVKAAGRSLPMWATGFHPQQWTQESVLLVGRLLAFGGLAVSQMQNERLLVELIHAGVDEAALRDLFGWRLDNVDFNLVRQVKISNKLSDDALELLTDLPRLAGSNAFAVSPHRSATGNALLASDPHLEVNRLPAIWYEVALEWRDRYVMGASLPGCPLLAVARTEKLAWGVTYMKGDTIDYFIEDCRRSDAGQWQFRRGRRWYDFSVRREVIERRQADVEKMRVLENETGILDGDPDVDGPGYYLSLAWTGRESGGAQAMSTWLSLVAAGGVEEAMEIVRGCPQPTLNFVLADRAGNIGLQGCGRFPQRRKGVSGLAPVAAWERRNHWRGFLTSEELPSMFNPPEGYLATANEEPRFSFGRKLVSQPLPDYRVRRILERLSEIPKVQLADLQSIQYDMVSLQARDLLDALLVYFPEGPVKDRLAAWDCSYHPDSHEASLFQRFYRHLMIDVFGNERGLGARRMLYLITRAGFSMMTITAADRLLQQPESHWFTREEKSERVRAAAEKLASAPSVPWRDVNNFHFTDRFFGGHRAGRLLGYASRKYPMPGNHATPFQGHVLQTATRESTFAPSYHFVTDLGSDEAWTNLPGGPSESRFSRYYKSDIPLWFDGEYKRLALR